MALDRLGGVELTLVYCTLCGTVIPYESEVGGQLVKFVLMLTENRSFLDTRR